MSKPMKPIVVHLNAAQRQVMATAYEAAEAISKKGKPWLMMAQIVGDWMVIHFLDTEQGIAYQKLIGVAPNKIGKTMRDC